MPIALMAQNARGIPTYYGRKDIVNFLARIDMRRIPWKRYTFSQKATFVLKELRSELKPLIPDGHRIPPT